MWRRKKEPVDFLKQGEALIASMSSPETNAMRRAYWEEVSKDPQRLAAEERSIAESQREIDRIMRKEQERYRRLAELDD